MEPNAEILDLERQVYAYAITHGANPVDQHYIETSRESDPRTYCRDCVQTAFAEVATRWLGNLDVEVWIGMSVGGEQDTCMRCDACGRLLSYCLTNYGAGEELAHFSKKRFPRKPLPPDVAYEISAMLSGIAYSKEPDDVAAAIRVGRRAKVRIT